MPWGRSQKSKALVTRFVAAVNAHDADAMRDLVSDDFTYIDSWREAVSGRDAVMLGVERLFEADDGFSLDVESMSYSDPYVLMRGWANSSVAAFGRRRAVWKAYCEGGKIAEWQSMAEGRPPAMNRTYSPEATTQASERTDVPPAAA